MKRPLLLTALLCLSAFAALAAVPALDGSRRVGHATAAPDSADNAISDARFSTLVRVLQAAKQVDALAKLPEETPELLARPNERGGLDRDPDPPRPERGAPGGRRRR